MKYPTLQTVKVILASLLLGTSVVKAEPASPSSNDSRLEMQIAKLQAQIDLNSLKYRELEKTVNEMTLKNETKYPQRNANGHGR